MDGMIPIPTQYNVISENPISTVRLYSGVPWDNKYIHVRLYSGQSQLLSALDKWKVKEINNLAPIRVGELTVKVPYHEMEMLNVNYLAFQNPQMSDRWVFCFVTAIQWQSRNSTTIVFELDTFQNEFYNCTMHPSFVEYMHIPKSEDTIGANLNPVNIETGDPVVAYYDFYSLTDWHICAYATEGTTGTDFEGKLCNNVYRAASLWHKAISDPDAIDGNSGINALIKAYNDQGKIDAIVALFMAPELCVNVVADPGHEEDEKKIPMHTNNLFEGYTPKNNKLYSYPWCYVLCDNNEGQGNIYKYELSDNSDNSIDFVVQGALATMPQVICFPRNYKGNSLNYDDAMMISGFPQCAYSSDTFRAWIAQNKSTLALSAVSAGAGILTGAVGIAGSPATGGLSGVAGVNAIGSSFQNVLSLIATASDKERLPATVHGKILSENINAAIGVTGYSFYTMSCKRQFAEIADSYFSTFGYPINKIVQPNITSRSSWNYIKTKNIGLYGNVDLAELAKLRTMFDNGVTIWHTDDIGNYGLDNN